MFADFLGLDSATLTVIMGACATAASAIGAGVWRILVWIDAKVSYFLERQDKFMAKLENNDGKRIEILSEIGKDNALKAKAIEATNDRLDALNDDVREVKTAVSILQDRLPCARPSSAAVPKLPQV
jgi:hypothetical protein